MPFKVYDSQRENRMYLRLVEDGAGNVYLRVVDSSGYEVSSGNILRVNANGTVTLFGGIEQLLGFQLDHRNQVMLTNPLGSVELGVGEAVSPLDTTTAVSGYVTPRFIQSVGGSEMF